MKKFSKSLFVAVFAALLCCSVALFGCSDKTDDLKPLSSPTGLTYADGSLTWAAVEGATNGYTVIVLQGDEQKLKDEKVTGTSYSVSTLAAGNYTAKVSANAVADTFKASASASLDFTVAAPEAEKLAAPTGIAYNKATQTVTFEAVENATAYIVSATVKGSTTVSAAEREITETSISLPALGFTTTEHTLKVVARGNGTQYTDSDAATFDLTIEKAKLAAPATVEYKAATDTVEWAAVIGADGYGLEIIKDGETEDLGNDDLFENVFDASELPKGTFTVNVMAYADQNSIFWTDGDAKTDTFTIDSMGALLAPANMKVESGSIVWDANNARGYDVKIYNATSATQKGALVEGVKPYIDGNSLVVARMGLDGGSNGMGKNYIAEIKATSNRHDSEESEAKEISFYIETIKQFLPNEIKDFSGSAPRGEHAAVEVVKEGGVDYARVRPDNTVDGWGRVCSPDVTVDWNRKPVVYLEMGLVQIGGYHMQIRYNGSNIDCLRDTQRTQSTVVDILKESGMKYTGISAVALRIGVDHSNPLSENNARADYKSVTMMYVTDYDPGLTEPTTLATPTDLAINSYGELTFSGVRFAEKYEVKAFSLDSEGTETAIPDKDAMLTATTLDLKTFGAGNYKLKIVAKNDSNANAGDSEAAEIKFNFEVIKTFTAENLATSGDNSQFVPGGNGLEGTYDADAGVTTVTGMQSAGNVEHPEYTKGWGWIYMKDGIDIRFSRNPLIMVDIESLEGNDPTYISRIQWTGGGEFAPFGDTRDTITEKKTIVVRAGYDENGNRRGVGNKSGYKFGIGPANNTTMKLSGMRIVYIYENKPLVRPETPAKLDAPSGFRLKDKSILTFDSVEGNDEYAPTYKYTVTEKGSATAIATLTKQEMTELSLAALNLENGKTYTVSAVAEGDTYTDDTKPYFADSDAATIDIEYTEILKVDDFTPVVTTGDNKMWKQFAGDEGASTVVTAANDGNALKFTINESWGLVTIPVLTGALNSKDGISANSTLEYHFGEVTGNPAFTSRYSTDMEGTKVVDARGDTPISSNSVLVDTNLYERVTFTTINGANGFWIGVGFGGGSGERTYQINKIVIAEYKLA